MAERGNTWRRANQRKIPEIVIYGLVAHGGLLRTPLNEGISFGWVRTNADGFEFMKALDPQGEIYPTVAMFLAMLERMEKVSTGN